MVPTGFLSTQVEIGVPTRPAPSHVSLLYTQGRDRRSESETVLCQHSILARCSPLWPGKAAICHRFERWPGSEVRAATRLRPRERVRQ